MKSKLVAESLKQSINEGPHNSGQNNYFRQEAKQGATFISPEDFAGFVKCIIAIDDSSFATKAWSYLLDVHPTLRKQVKTDDAYSQSVDDFIEAYPSIM